MAQRRMISKTITNSAKFIKMPSETQALYFHLCISADDDGVCEAFSVMRSIGSSEDNIRILNSKWFIKILNEDLVSYIMDWDEHNFIRADRKIDSIYKDLLLQIVPWIELVEPKERADRKNRHIGGTSHGQPMDGTGKDRIGKVSLVENSIDNNISVQQSWTSDEIICTDVDAISIPVEWQRPMKVKKTKPKIEYPQEIEELYQTIKKTSWVIVDSKEHAMIELQEKLKTTSAEKILELSRITWRAIKVWILDAQYIKRMWRWVRDLDTEWELQENSVIKYILDKAIAITVHHKKKWTESSRKWNMKDDIAPLLIWWLDENWIPNNALRLYYRKWTESLMDNPQIK